MTTFSPPHSVGIVISDHATALSSYYHHLTDQSQTSSVGSELQSSVDSELRSSVHSNLYQYVEPPMEDQLSESEGHVHKNMCVDAAAGMIIKLKEGCKLTQKAMSEVVNIADFTCNHVIHQTQGVVKEICERHGLNLDSTLVVDIQNSLEQIHSPFSELATNYRQNSYISSNMPYVVRNILQRSCLINCIVTCLERDWYTHWYKISQC